MLKEDDFIEQFFVASTHDYVLFITNQGKAYWVKVHEIPESSREAKGQSIKVLLSLSSEEEITAVVSLRNFTDEKFVLMATRQGVVKKVKISEFANAKTRGIVAIKLDQGDGLVTALLTSGSDEAVLVTRKGIALRFHEEAVRAMGRASHGVQGIKLSQKDELAGVAMVNQGEQMLLVSEFGFGKRTAYDNFSPHGRGTRGQICYKATEKTGEVIGVLSVSDTDDLVCITSQGNTLKLRVLRGCHAREDRHGRAHREYHAARCGGRRGPGRQGRRERGRSFRRLSFRPKASQPFLLCDFVPADHVRNSLADMGIHIIKVTPENRKKLLTQRLAPNHPLVIVPSTVMIRTVELGAGDLRLQPVEKLLVSRVHSQRHLGVKPVPAEVALADENTHEEAFFEVVHFIDIQTCCFTVKLHVKRQRA